MIIMPMTATLFTIKYLYLHVIRRKRCHFAVGILREFVKPSRRWKDSVKIRLKEISCVDVNWLRIGYNSWPLDDGYKPLSSVTGHLSIRVINIC